MKLRTIDLLRIAFLLIFGGVSVGITLFFFGTDLIGWIALASGFMIGWIGTELHYVPMLRQKWRRVGVPGYEKTEEQTKAAQAEKRTSSWTTNLAIIVGLIAFALWKRYLPPQIQNITLVILWGGIEACVSRVIWLIYQEGKKLEDS
jgi:hypothetical protein